MFETQMNQCKLNIIYTHPHVCIVGNLILSDYSITMCIKFNHHLNRQWSAMTPNATAISQCLRVISKLQYYRHSKGHYISIIIAVKSQSGDIKKWQRPNYK